MNENGRIPQAHKAFDHFETILYAFYNKELSIDDTNMSTALADCYQLLQISDYLGCTGMVSKPIEVVLLKQGQDLFRAIQKAPFAWVEMAYRIRSELVFSECMIHLIGNWKTLKSGRSVGDCLRAITSLRELIETYHFKLLHKCKALELSIMSLYPGTMRLPVGDLPIKRESYAKDILVWMALMFFRHWLSQRLITEKGRHNIDCGFELYKQMGTGGDCYMDKSVINQFHTKFPMTKKALNVLENHLREIKECVKDVVDQHKILESNCQLDIHRFPVKYLTCTVFQRSDYPWLQDNATSRVVPAKRKYKLGGNDIARENLDKARMFQGRSSDVEGVDEDGEFGQDSDSDSNSVSAVVISKRVRTG